MKPARVSLLVLALVLSAGPSVGRADQVIPFGPPASSVSAENWMPKQSGNTYYDKYTFDGYFEGKASSYFSILNSNMLVKREIVEVQSRITLPDGRELRTKEELKKGEWSAEKQGGNFTLKLGKHTVTGDLRKWTVRVQGEGYEAELVYEAQVPAWRPQSGRTYFGSDKSLYFDLTLLSPRAEVTANVKVGAETFALKGLGWGSHSQANVEPHRQAKRWLTLRSHSGAWVVWVNEFVTTSMFGEVRVPWLLVAKGRKVLFQSFNYTLTAKETKTDEKHPNRYTMPMAFVIDAQDGANTLKLAVKARKLKARKDQLERLSAIERAVVSKVSQPITYELDADYSLEMTIDGQPLAHKARGVRYEVEFLTK